MIACDRTGQRTCSGSRRFNRRTARALYLTPETLFYIEQMYLNITPCQLYLRLRQLAANAPLLSTFGPVCAGHSVLCEQVSGIHHDVKPLALELLDCQKWRTSHFAPMSKGFNDEQARSVTIGRTG